MKTKNICVLQGIALLFGSLVSSASGADVLFSPPISTPTGGSGPTSVVAADFNGDGMMDLAVAHRNEHTVAVLLGNGDGTFQDPVIYQVGIGLSVAGVLSVGDFNNDGFPDLVVPDGRVGMDGDTVSVLIGNGDGTFQSAVRYVARNVPISSAVGDFNRDGNLDIILGGNPVTGLLLGNGDGSFQDLILLPGGDTEFSLAVGDFNGDGFLDAVGVGYDRAATVWLGNGDGTFQSPVSTPIPIIRPISVVIADFNGDGKLDIVCGNDSSNIVTVHLGNGDGTFQSPVILFGGLRPFSVGAGDFDGDGIPDVAAASFDENLVRVSMGNGDGTFRPPTGGFPTDDGPGAFVVADFNGDGVPDIATANFRSNTVSILLNQTPFSATR